MPFLRPQGLLSGMVVLLGASTAPLAFALPAGLDIDFRASEWADADHRSTFTLGDITLISQPGGTSLRQGSRTGLGVDSSVWFEDPKEIGPFETLVVRFGTPRQLEGVWLTKLFDEWVDDSGSLELFSGTESQGVFRFAGTSSGELFVDFAGPIETTEARFTGEHRNLLDLVLQRDFSVAGFQVAEAGNPAPSPSPERLPDAGPTLAMLGGGLAVLLALRRRARA